ncbi:hypothetical protein [Streptomyces sp. CoT10]|uniref:hypothetical protein n=1 Tax=Streptomyces sp. CoT10 TaxID=2875762 RepID=UPI001CD73521|nr:hypothetical protein [Streptomyces sp. CoT10]
MLLDYLEQRPISGKVAFVTGASSGMGLAAAAAATGSPLDFPRHAKASFTYTAGSGVCHLNARSWLLKWSVVGRGEESPVRADRRRWRTATSTLLPPL